MERILTVEMQGLFVVQMHTEGLSEGTVEKYVRDVRVFAAWLGGREVTKERAAAWRDALVHQGYAPVTVNSMLAALNAFFRFMNWHDCRVRFLKIQRQVFRDRSRELTEAEYKRLVETARQNGQERLELLLQAIGATGIRVSEVKYLTVEAARQGKAVIALKGRIRTILLPSKLCRMLLKYAGKRKIASGEIFLAKGGNSLSRKQIWAEMKRLCKRAGVEAHKMIRQHDPNIVITDIQLPGMTGLELIESVVNEGNAPRFIVVSGFREFEYAQRALRFGVEDYLLKPIDQEEINVVLRQLIEKMSSEQKDTEEQHHMAGMLEERTAILRQSEFKQLVHNPEHLFKTDFFHFGEEDSLFCIIAMRIQLKEVNESTVEVARRILQNIAARVEKRFVDDCYDIEMLVYEDNCLCLLNFSQTMHRKLHEKKEELQHILQESNVKYAPDKLVVAMGRPVASARQLGEALRSAWAAFDMRIRSDSSYVMEFTREVGTERAITDTDRRQLETFLFSLQKDGVQEYLQSMFSNILLRMPDRLGRLYSELRAVLDCSLPSL